LKEERLPSSGTGYSDQLQGRVNDRRNYRPLVLVLCPFVLKLAMSKLDIGGDTLLVPDSQQDAAPPHSLSLVFRAERNLNRFDSVVLLELNTLKQRDGFVGDVEPLNDPTLDHTYNLLAFGCGLADAGLSVADLHADVPQG